MTKPTTAPRPAAVQLSIGGRLTRLLGRTAAGDREAFRRLYMGLAGPTWRVAVALLGCPDAASSVTDATFVEVWYLATSFDPTVDDGGGWIASIAARRCQDRLRATNMAGSRPIGDMIAAYDIRLRRELGALLAADLTTICDPTSGAATDSGGGVADPLPA